MSIKSRLLKLEQKTKEIDIEEINRRLRELVGKHLGLDLSRCADSDFEAHTKTSLRLCFMEVGAVYVEDWTNQRLAHELRGIIYRAAR
jgi:hypothetical protein